MRWLLVLLLALPVAVHAQDDAHMAGARVADPFPDEEPVDRDDVEAVFVVAQQELRACLETAGIGRASVRVRIDAEQSLTITARATPRDDGAESCLDLALRNYLVPMLPRVTRPIRASTRVDQASIPRPDRRRYSRELVEALGTVEPALTACTVHHRGGGTFTVRGSSTDAGVVSVELAWSGHGRASRRAGPAVLSCLRTAVSALRITPGAVHQADREIPRALPARP